MFSATVNRLAAHPIGIPRIVLTAAIAAMACMTPKAALADAVEDFYKGKQLRFIIRSDPGGSYDQLSRMLGRHIGKYIPGNPTSIPINMPGAGGLLAINHVAQIAPKDGTILIIPALGLPMYQALDFFGDKLKADLGKFHWVGNISDSNPVVITWHSSKVKTLADAKKEVAHLGTSGAGSISAQLPAVYNNLLGTKFRVIYGYDGDETIALERGEIDGRATNTWSSYKSTKPDWVKNNRINYILQIGLKKEAELPNVPLLLDLAANDEQKQIFTFFSQVVALSRPVATTPEVPADRVGALRKAFMATMKDPDFLADAEKQQVDVGPMEGAEVQRLTQAILDTPPALLSKVRAAMTHRSGDEVKYEKK